MSGSAVLDRPCPAVHEDQPVREEKISDQVWEQTIPTPAVAPSVAASQPMLPPLSPHMPPVDRAGIPDLRTALRARVISRNKVTTTLSVALKEGGLKECEFPNEELSLQLNRGDRVLLWEAPLQILPEVDLLWIENKRVARPVEEIVELLHEEPEQAPEEALYEMLIDTGSPPESARRSAETLIRTRKSACC